MCCVCVGKTSTPSLLEGENPLQCLCSLISVFGQEFVGGMFVLKGFRCSLRDNFQNEGIFEDSTRVNMQLA